MCLRQVYELCRTLTLGSIITELVGTNLQGRVDCEGLFRTIQVCRLLCLHTLTDPANLISRPFEGSLMVWRCVLIPSNSPPRVRVITVILP